jgi:fatty acid desaturase
MEDDSGRDGLRAQALQRIKKKREFAAHAFAFVAVNGFLVVIWATVAGGGFFWPIFPIFGWGIGLFFHAWDVYKGEPTEDEIAREMERISRRRR